MNTRELRVIGMSRSGNHAVINWILAQAPGRSCFLNCTEPKFNPFTTARPLDDGRAMLVNYEPFDPAQERCGRFSAKDWLIYSHEDCFLGTVANAQSEERHDQWVGPSLSRQDVLVIRDPYNLFASRRKSGIGEVSDATALRIWKQHAREFLGLRRYLEQARVLVNYNRWAKEKAYRESIAAQLGLRFDDAAFRSVPAAANGSSFDGRRYDGQAHRMRTEQRWAHYARDAAFAGLFDRDTHALSKRIFGPTDYDASVALDCISATVTARAPEVAESV